MQTAQESVYRRLRDELINGQWKGGESLSEPKLAARFGVNRNPVREALLRLAAEGLLERSPGVGCRVPRWDIDAVSDMYQLREAIEGMAARLAAERVDRVLLLRMEHEENLFEELTDIDGGPPEAYESDLRFHQFLIEASGNRALRRAWDQNRIFLVSSRQLIAYAEGKRKTPVARDPRIDIEEHRHILAALQQRDPNEAEAAARAHVADALEDLEHLAKLIHLQEEGHAAQAELTGVGAPDAPAGTSVAEIVQQEAVSFQDKR